MAKTTLSRTFPWSETIGGEEVTFRLMTAADKDAVLAFGRHLPDESIVFLRMDITDEAVVDQWIHNIDQNFTLTVLAEQEGTVVGYGSLHYNKMLWTRHLGEVRLRAARDFAQPGELEERLASIIFQCARDLGLQRLTAQVRADIPRTDNLFERLGFQPEAVLTDWLMDREGVTHDLLVLALHLENA